MGILGRKWSGFWSFLSSLNCAGVLPSIFVLASQLLLLLHLCSISLFNCKRIGSVFFVWLAQTFFRALSASPPIRSLVLSHSPPLASNDNSLFNSDRFRTSLA
jgi:hypothetical protein